MQVAEVPPKESDLKNYRSKSAPRCPIHGALMRCGSTTQNVRYFYCVVDGCRCSEKQVR